MDNEPDMLKMLMIATTVMVDDHDGDDEIIATNDADDDRTAVR